MTDFYVVNHRLVEVALFQKLGNRALVELPEAIANDHTVDLDLAIFNILWARCLELLLIGRYWHVVGPDSEESQREHDSLAVEANSDRSLVLAQHNSLWPGCQRLLSFARCSIHLPLAIHANVQT